MGESLAALNGNYTTITDKSIVEPLAASPTITGRLEAYFPSDLYSHSTSSLLYKFLTSLLGDSGVNGIKKAMLYPRISGSIYNTYFSDLDAFYTSIFGFARIIDEIYVPNPFDELIDIDQWQEIRRKDAWYRERCLKYLRGLQLGTTKRGLELICEAASGVECSIVERWKYLDDLSSDTNNDVQNIGQTLSRNEFIVVPNTDNLSLHQARRISEILHKTKPVDSVFTIYPQYQSRIPVEINGISTSSNYFQSERYVIGSQIVNYPQKDPKYGLWIEPGVENLRPALSFAETQEFITWITIEDSSATSYHTGPFNRTQRHLFSHLNDIEDDLYQFTPDEAYLEEPVPLNIIEPWVSRQPSNFKTVGGTLNLGYFSDSNISASSKNLFWASKEKFAPETDTLTIDLGATRNINYLEFEICTKPISFKVEYLDENGAWLEVDYIQLDLAENDTTIVFNLQSNTWHKAQIGFDRVQTQKIRIVLTRDDTPFPYPNSPAVEWSIEIRNLRVGDIVVDIEDLLTYDYSDGKYLSQEGSDVLGNKYRTVVDPDRFSESKLIDGELNTYWQSQINPSKFAVESIYIDIRDENGNPSTVDEIYIDPITAGCLMHIYWTNEDIGGSVPPLYQTPEDWRLWTPDPSHYILTKGYHPLRRPITAKYLKLEFTNLTVIPYKAIEVQTKPVRYKTHPSWAENQINAILDLIPQIEVLYDNERIVSYSYSNLGIINPTGTKLDPFGPQSLENFDRFNISDFNNLFVGYQTWDKNNTNNQYYDIENSALESEVNLYIKPFEDNLINSLNQFNFLNEVVLQITLADFTFFNVEIPLLPKEVFDIGSVEDKTEALIEKSHADTWFPIRSRHGYKVVESPREADVGYMVAIREISLFRKDYSGTSYDFDFYTDNLIDDTHITTNSLQRVQGNWALVISDEYFGVTDQNLGEFTFNYEPEVPIILTDAVGAASDSITVSEATSVDFTISNSGVQTITVTESTDPVVNLAGQGSELISVSEDVDSEGSDYLMSTSDSITISEDSEGAIS